MRRFVRLLLAIPLTCLILGCERPSVTSGDSSSSPATAPTTVPAQAGPATQPTTEPAQPRASYILIDQQRVAFPPAKLVVRARGDRLQALLYSDDPPQAIEDSYVGNSYYFEMSIDAPEGHDAPEGQDITSVRWLFKAPTSERSDTVSGIYLDGRKRHLQPFDVVAEFDHAGVGKARVWVGGQFLLFDPNDDPTMPGQLIPVVAELEADVVRKN